MRAAFYRSLVRPGARKATRLLAQARWLRQAADEVLPSPWRDACQRVLALAAPVDHAESRAGSMRALQQLAERALLRRARLDGAIARLERAAHLDPDNPEVAFALAQTLARWEAPGPLWRCQARTRTDEAIDAYTRLNNAHPSYRPAAVAVELAVLHTRVQAFGQARAEYRRALALSFGQRSTALLHNNLGEVTMLAGDLEGALRHYQRGLERAQDSRDRALALWGLSIAHDRLGEHGAALDRALQALQAEGGQMRVLHAPGVFFEPPRERLYYEALGHEALAQEATSGAPQHLQEAAEGWRAYLSRAPQHDPFADNARANLARVEAVLGSERGRAAHQAKGSTKGPTDTLP